MRCHGLRTLKLGTREKFAVGEIIFFFFFFLIKERASKNSSFILITGSNENKSNGRRRKEDTRALFITIIDRLIEPVDGFRTSHGMKNIILIINVSLFWHRWREKISIRRISFWNRFYRWSNVIELLLSFFMKCDDEIALFTLFSLRNLNTLFKLIFLFWQKKF